jgi:hypothetical protein
MVTYEDTRSPRPRSHNTSRREISFVNIYNVHVSCPTLLDDGPRRHLVLPSPRISDAPARSFEVLSVITIWSVWGFQLRCSMGPGVFRDGLSRSWPYAVVCTVRLWEGLSQRSRVCATQSLHHAYNMHGVWIHLSCSLVVPSPRERVCALHDFIPSFSAPTIASSRVCRYRRSNALEAIINVII